MLRKILLIAIPAIIGFAVCNNNYQVRAWTLDKVHSVERTVQQTLNRNRR